MFTRAITLRATLRSLNVQRQHIKIGCLMQKRYQHHLFSEQQYQEISKIKNTTEFPYNSVIKPMSVASETEKQEFASVWPELIDNFVNICSRDIPELQEHYRKLLLENVGTNKQASGILTLISYKMFEDPGKLTPENVKLASVLGWCVNMMLSQFMITDDIVDRAVVRYGKPSWYTKSDIGMTAINDATLMDNGIYLLLEEYFVGHHCHFPATNLFRHVNVKVLIGLALDSMANRINGKPLLASFTTENYKRIAEYKGCYPEYILSVVLGMHLAGKYDSELIRMAKAFCCELGFYFTAQNDVLDCYGNPAITGKDGTDISEGKCTWLVVEALKRGTSEQKQILSEHYGRAKHESEVKVRSVFDELDLLREFLNYEENSFNAVRRMIQEMPKDLNREFFIRNAEATYERKL